MKAKTLLILRHGKSDWTTGDEDYHRPLVARGRQGSQKMGAWIRQQKLVPEAVISSPAERARATTILACKAMGLPAKTVRWDERLYAAPVEALLAALAECPKNTRRVMLVGHNPGLEELVEYLASHVDVPEDGKILPTSALARLELLEDWRNLAQGCATVVSLTRPGELGDDLLVKAAEDADARGPVPDYFFTQSAVLPYRRRDGKLEMMIVASRRGTRWVLPKGVKEPELSLRDSASKEALEEAGIRGELDEEPIGHYDYAKWGGVCSVAVFPMAVSECIPDAEWEENHRQRRWVPAKEARRLLDEPALRKLVDKLEKRLK
ncbi:MAG TPA: histidine phosphatase family protein [Accumulibacter sp.]|uniref:histidine phosphatase family protein n=1 Tax=Accumulibacter sp. TaxID=2053492 RepID=UPI002C697A1B|nr:histidine phosphatase family protein [Accumulibacter sp.]HMV04108.1 histidine phosphatase family protein [Accumulibacter sp.]HMX69445.1 histidine phosphatase family protein [Accumulibacter sp.]HNE39364.1 histidine phosphatase family protein [Accumulibacter sp.]HNG86446.1 histidine phosphatase family protein [Accumulibacter sp.]